MHVSKFTLPPAGILGNILKSIEFMDKIGNWHLAFFLICLVSISSWPNLICYEIPPIVICTNI